MTAVRGVRSRAPVSIDILVEAGDWPDAEALRPAVERAIAAAVAAARPPLAGDPELSLVFTDDSQSRRLNLAYRGKDSATNVLSFPGAPADSGRFGPLLGDIVVAGETIGREAAAEGLTFDDHLTHLIVHGFLHLLGYDHLHDGDAARMERLETAILAALGIADPYAED